jgi:hypothetical protein
VVTFPFCAITGIGPNVKCNRTDVKKTAAEAFAMFVTIVLFLIRPPRHLKLSEVKADSNIARRIEISPPYIRKERIIAASDMVT